MTSVWRSVQPMTVHWSSFSTSSATPPPPPPPPPLPPPPHLLCYPASPPPPHLLCFKHCIQQQSAADASVQQRMAHELQQLTAAHAQQMAARAQAHAAELQQLRVQHSQDMQRLQARLEAQRHGDQQQRALWDAERCARTAVAEDALLGYVAVIAASVQQGQAVLHRRLEEAHGHAAALEAQLEHQQQQGAVKDATIQALAQSKEQKKRTLKQQELAITTLKEQKKVEVAQWQMAVQRLTQVPSPPSKPAGGFGPHQGKAMGPMVGVRSPHKGMAYYQSMSLPMQIAPSVGMLGTQTARIPVFHVRS